MKFFIVYFTSISHFCIPDNLMFLPILNDKKIFIEMLKFNPYIAIELKLFMSS
ncbi:MAG: hypothetical protein HXY50_13645 [Ignavibacteriaceae bacterium]|nr:hypothetical protein [Ignavibacteriaceae bacterium]